MSEPTGEDDGGETGRAEVEAAEAAAEAAVVKAGRSIIDGVAQLFSEIAQGTSNSLHSKAELIIRAVIDAVVRPDPNASGAAGGAGGASAKRKRKASKESGGSGGGGGGLGPVELRQRRRVYVAVAEKFLEFLCDFVKPDGAGAIWEELLAALESAVANSKAKTADVVEFGAVVGAVLGLAHDCLACKDALLLRKSRDTSQPLRVLGALDTLTSPKVYSKLPAQAQQSVVEVVVVCGVYTVGGDEGMAARLPKFLHAILRSPMVVTNTKSFPALRIAEALLPPGVVSHNLFAKATMATALFETAANIAMGANADGDTTVGHVISLLFSIPSDPTLPRPRMCACSTHTGTCTHTCPLQHRPHHPTSNRPSSTHASPRNGPTSTTRRSSSSRRSSTIPTSRSPPRTATTTTKRRRRTRRTRWTWTGRWLVL